MIPRNRVLLALVAIGLAGALSLNFLTLAPNRLVSGAPVPFGAGLHVIGGIALLPGLILAGLAFLRPSRTVALGAVVCASLFLTALVWLAGSEAARLAATSPPAARVAIGAGFWVMFGATALAIGDGVRRLALSPLLGTAAGLLAASPVAAVIGVGLADQLGVLREYVAERGVFTAAVVRHVELVLAALLLALCVALPLGVLAARRAAWRTPLFSALNVIQTIPAIAMFGLLMAPLTAIAHLAPPLAAWGIGGIGMAPAVLALMLYGLLPIARNTEAGFTAVPAPVLDAARGIGMTSRQILLRVELPLALPIFLAGVRITLVQLVGLAVLAALVGAGGLGAIMFQGLFADALDQVLLGVIPVVLLAIIADTAMNVLIALTRPGR